MLTILMIIMGLAALFGFSLTVYFFFYKVQNLARPLRWLGGIAGGAIVGSIAALAILLLLWPPFSFMLLAGGLAVATIATIMIIPTRTGKKEVASLIGGEDNGHLDTYGLDLDAGTRP